MITLRKARKSDDTFIARMVLAALHIDENSDTRLCRHIKDLVEDEGTLYSWHRCIIATDDDESVGMCLAYDAADYHERRLRSFTMPCSDGKSVAEDNTSLLEQEDEAGEGEYYIDSVAVVASHRRGGIGRTLMADAIAKGKALQLRPTLLVDPANTNAVKLYTSLGFRYERDIFAFGQIYHKYSIMI